MNEKLKIKLFGTQPSAKISEELLEQLINREFPSSKNEVTEKLKLVNSDSTAGTRRISAAILKLTNRDFGKLDSLIQQANQDSRDILSAAEYPRISEEGFIGFNSRTESQNKELYLADWNEYSN